MAYITVTNTLVNGNTADAGELNTNFTDIINGTSDGSKDLNVAALTCAGNVTFNGNTTIGNATSDTVTFTARAASDFLPSADDTYDLGSSSLKWADIRGVLGTFTGLLTAESGIKPSSGSDALTYYSTEDVELDSEFTGGELTLRCTRVGNNVCISGLGVPTHSSGDGAITSTGIIPSAYLPPATIGNIFYAGSSFVCKIVISAGTGVVTLTYLAWDGSTYTSATSPVVPIGISYNVS